MRLKVVMNDGKSEYEGFVKKTPKNQKKRTIYALFNQNKVLF